MKMSKKKSKELKRYAADIFEFHNGDVYEGEFAVDHDIPTVYRHGQGTYTCANGCTITGNWFEDIPAGEIIITFRNFQQFIGFTEKTLHYARGTYKFIDGCYMEGDFMKNFTNFDASGIIFKGPNHKIWKHELTECKEIILKFDWRQAFDPFVCTKDCELEQENENDISCPVKCKINANDFDVIHKQNLM